MYPFIKIQLSSYALMACIGLFCSLIAAYCRSEKFGFSFREMLLGASLCALGALLGSKLLYILATIPELRRSASLYEVVSRLITSGFVFYGGFFGAIAGAAVYNRVRRADLHRVINYLLPSMVLFHAFGRIGCFLAGCCYGIPFRYGIVMPGVSADPRLPVQLIESAFEFALFFILLKKEKSDPRYADDKSCVLLFYLSCYAPFRFVLEFFRGDAIRGIWGVFSTSQWISLAVMVICLCADVRAFNALRARQKKADTDAAVRR